MNGIALTNLDVLDGFEMLKICTGYRLEGQVIDHLPTAADQQARVEPIYEEMPGWSESTEGARRWLDLPAEAIKYIKRVEELIDCYRQTLVFAKFPVSTSCKGLRRTGFL